MHTPLEQTVPLKTHETEATDNSTVAIEAGQLPPPRITHDLWSRGFQNVSTCPDVPQSYWDAGTETRHNGGLLARYFSSCGGILWLRACDINVFIDDVLPKMTKSFVIITTDGDLSVPSGVPSAIKLLDSPLLEKWYTQNYDGSIAHHKLFLYPIGFDLHTQRAGNNDNPVSQKEMMAYRDTINNGVNVEIGDTLTKRENDLFYNFGWLNRPRQEALREIDCGGVTCGINCKRMASGTLVFDVWNSYNTYNFGLSPFGNGLDCHRTWEMLLFGMIPVVKSSSLDPLYDDLPVVIVKEWGDLCGKDLGKIAESLRARREAMTNDGEIVLLFISCGGLYDSSCGRFRILEKKKTTAQTVLIARSVFVLFHFMSLLLRQLQHHIHSSSSSSSSSFSSSSPSLRTFSIHHRALAQKASKERRRSHSR